MRRGDGVVRTNETRPASSMSQTARRGSDSDVESVIQKPRPRHLYIQSKVVTHGLREKEAMITLCIAWVVYFGPIADTTRHEPLREECHQAEGAVAKREMLSCASSGVTCKVMVDGPRVVLQHRFSCGRS